MSYKALADHAVEFASRPYFMPNGERRPPYRIDTVVAVPSSAMPLLLNATESLPTETRIDHPLIRTGLLYFEEAWPRPERGTDWQGLFFSYEVLNDDGTPSVFGLHLISSQDHLTLREDGTWRPMGVPTDIPEDDLRYRVVTAFNLLIEQKVIVATTERPSRQIRRRSEREGRPPMDVTIIQLPHRVYSSSNEETNHNRYSHQWLVSGHWRQQPYPSVSEIHPLWISPYVKGPEDKPLVIKERRFIFNPPNNEQ